MYVYKYTVCVQYIDLYVNVFSQHALAGLYMGSLPAELLLVHQAGGFVSAVSHWQSPGETWCLSPDNKQHV